MKNLAFVLVALCALSFYMQSTNGANILGVFTSPSHSHLIVHMSVMKALAERGHNITVVVSMEPKVTHANIRHVVIPPTAEQQKTMAETVTGMASEKSSAFKTMTSFLSSFKVLIEMQFDALRNERFTALYGTKFDLVVMGFFMNDFQLGIAAKFNCPIIVDWSSAPMEMVAKFIGNPREVAYVPSTHLISEVRERMSFWQRVQNMISHLFFRVIGVIFEINHNRMYRQLFGDAKDFPSLQDMRKNVSLLFCNSHFSEGPIRPDVPALIEIGGIQIKEKPNALPKDIADLLNASERNGAILFSLGSVLQSENIQTKTVQAIFKALASLKQNVIWKWDDLEHTPGKAKNILYKKWVPQDDILAHPNIKLFITHAGKGGIAEAQYHAVPMVALPVFADQHGNAGKMVNSGYGLQLDQLELTEDTLKSAILEVINNRTYADKVKKFSQLYRDRPQTAKQSVVFWTEYVLRHHGAAHMQSPMKHLNLIQLLSLDVIAFIVAILYIVFKIFKFIVMFIISRVCTKCKKNTKTKKNKKAKKQ